MLDILSLCCHRSVLELTLPSKLAFTETGAAGAFPIIHEKVGEAGNFYFSDGSMASLQTTHGVRGINGKKDPVGPGPDCLFLDCEVCAQELLKLGSGPQSARSLEVRAVDDIFTLMDGHNSLILIT